MNYSQYPISPYSAQLSPQNLRSMIRLVHLLQQLSENKRYQNLLSESLPFTAHLNPNHYAVMMGYDFHITAEGPKLIEVNTNAGGLWLAYLCYQPDAMGFSPRLTHKLLQTFLSEYALFRQNSIERPKFIVILDENPQSQFLYPEMQVFAQQFQQAGIETVIAAPENLTIKNDGLYLDNHRIDLIYNRHCDFYLETDDMVLIRSAWLNRQVCLTPNPFVYGLLADKRRMILWTDSKLLKTLGLNDSEIDFLQQTIPQTLPLSALPSEQVWQSRKQWVFKPITSHASRGVYVGDKLTKGKLAELNPDNTLIQQYFPPSYTRVNDALAFKTDFRLFAYRDQILALSARLYQGQVTNLRTEKGGFAKVQLLKS